MNDAIFTRLGKGKWAVACDSPDMAGKLVTVRKRDDTREEQPLGQLIGPHPRKAGWHTYEIDRARGGKSPNAPKGTSVEPRHKAIGGPEAPLPQPTHAEPHDPSIKPASAAVSVTANAEPTTGVPLTTELADILAKVLSSPALDRVAVQAMIDASSSDLDMAEIKGVIAQAIVEMQPAATVIMLDKPEWDTPRAIEGRVHKAVAEILPWLAIRKHVACVGPAGSGKTSLARDLAKALGLDLYTVGALFTKHDATGFMSARAEYVGTMIRQGFEFGGLVLIDEMDVSTAQAGTSINAILDGALEFAFPDGMVTKHKDFVVLCSMNTYGLGADRQYVGRMQQDASFLNRFKFVTVDYDEGFETDLALAEYERFGGQVPDEARAYVAEVQAIRARVFEHKIRHIVSPRASIDGCAMLATGNLTKAQILEHAVWQGLDSASRAQVEVK